MGSIDQKLYGTVKFPVDIPLDPYDPWELPYFKAPEGVYKQVVEQTFPLIDIRGEVLDGESTPERSREFLRTHGFTAVKHQTALHSAPYGRFENFQDLELINDIYYPEVEALVKSVTGCSDVFITDSLIRGQNTDVKNLSNTSWKQTDATGKPSKSSQLHKPQPSPPTRLPHWDTTPLGARQMIRKWSPEITEHATRREIIRAEDETCAPASATDKESEAAILKDYDGPRYALLSVWRPLRKVTRDPLAMAQYRHVDADPDFAIREHTIKQPGTDGDWLRELATLKVTEKAAEAPREAAGFSKFLWHYVSDQDVDEVLIVKSFDSASLGKLAEKTGEAPGAPHASPDLGDAGSGEVRESIELRLLAFW